MYLCYVLEGQAQEIYVYMHSIYLPSNIIIFSDIISEHYILLVNLAINSLI